MHSLQATKNSTNIQEKKHHFLFVLHPKIVYFIFLPLICNLFCFYNKYEWNEQFIRRQFQFILSSINEKITKEQTDKNINEIRSFACSICSLKLTQEFLGEKQTKRNRYTFTYTCNLNFIIFFVRFFFCSLFIVENIANSFVLLNFNYKLFAVFFSHLIDYIDLVLNFGFCFIDIHYYLFISNKSELKMSAHCSNTQ